MEIPRPSDADRALFAAVMPDSPEVIVKPMFGNVGAFVNGNMFAGLFGSTIGVRVVAETTRAELAAMDGIRSFGPSERPMKEYLGLPADWDADSLATWVARAYGEVGALPPKATKPKTTKPKRGA
jgi:TfoX/Sxy family transcriptional regulator of competence genes